MPLAPYKDRTIKLTLETEYFAQNPQSRAVQSVVDLYLPSAGVGGQVKNLITGNSGTITLVGPTRMNVALTANIADESGIASTFLEPWQINNVPVKISGESYLGAFEALSVSDNDAPDILSMFYTALRDFSSRLGAAGTKERVVLEISNNPEGSARFIGYIKEFSISEDVKKPYILDYELTFLGKNFDDMSVASGKLGAKNDAAIASGSWS